MNEHDRLPTTVHVNVSTSFCVIVCVWVCGQKCDAILKMSEDSLQQEIQVKWELWIYPLAN